MSPFVVGIGVICVVVSVVFWGKNGFTRPEGEHAQTKVNVPSIPQHFPPSFPIYPNATVISSLDSSPDNPDGSLWLSMETQDTARDVQEFYDTRLAQTDWKIFDRITLDDGQTYILDHPQWSGTLAVSAMEEGALIVVVLKRQPDEGGEGALLQ